MQITKNFLYMEIPENGQTNVNSSYVNQLCESINHLQFKCSLAHQNKRINTFHRQHVRKFVNRWCNTKKHLLREGKCKVSEKRKSKILK